MAASAHDVVVVGGGPSGAACAYWLAEAGHDVLLLEKKQYPREKTCGDGLTPRSVKQLEDMGLGDKLAEHHRVIGLRSGGFGRMFEMEWPKHPDLPGYGYVVTRKDLDALVAERAVKAGATLWDSSEALAPVAEGGLLRGAVVKRKAEGGAEVEVRAKYVVVADGANSRFGRALGTSRRRDYPLGMAIRGYYESPRHDDAWIEGHLDIRDKAGNVLPGYGWVFPVGDGRVNVGIGLLSTFNQWKAVNTSHLMDAFVDYAPDYWEISPDKSCGPATGGRLPMGMSVGPHVGPTWLVTGDAGGLINPFNGEGIAYAYETGRLAAGVLSEALARPQGAARETALQAYPAAMKAAYGGYYTLGRVFVQLIGNPKVMQLATRHGLPHPLLMKFTLKLLANLTDARGGDALDRVINGLTKVVPAA